MATQNTNTRKNTIVIITALIAVIFATIVSTGFAAAGAESTGYLTGTAWYDANGNGMRDLNEITAPETAIYLHPVASNAAVAGGLVIFSDANGNFDFGSIGFGTYQIQAENGDITEITVSEVSAAVSVELPVTVENDGPMAQGTMVNQIFLPLVIR
jgi:hypothetical protein